MRFSRSRPGAATTPAGRIRIIKVYFIVFSSYYTEAAKRTGMDKAENARRKQQKSGASVSERKFFELRRKYSLLNSIFEESTDAIFVKDRQGRYVTINAVGAAIIGKFPEEIIGKTDSEVFPPEDAETLMELDRHILESGEPFADEEVITVRGEPRIFLSTKVVYRNAEGQAAGIIGIARDITHRKEAERALQKYQGQLERLVHERTADLEAANKRLAQEISERKLIEAELRVSERQLRGLIEGIDDAIFLHDSEGRILDCNESACRRLGYDRSQLLSMTTSDIDAPEFAVGFKERLSHQLSDGRYGCEGVHLSRDGRRIPVDIVTSVIDYHGAKAVLAVVRDISERKQAEKERQRLEAQIRHGQKLESLGLLAGGIAHDFNNLLLGILGNIQLALEELPPVSSVRESIKDMEVAAKQAADLARQMLNYSGKGHFAVRPLNLNEIVTEVQGLLSVSVSKKVELRYDLHQPLPAVRGDASQITQILMNLVTNASDAIIPAAGTITISTGLAFCDRDYLQETYLGEQVPEGNYVFLDVRDDGCGMKRETMERIFDPFFTTKVAGRGLGLAAVLGIMRGHQGTIKVYSEPGKGTSFKVFFPAADIPAAARHETVVELTELHGEGTILVVDDEESVRAVAKRILQRGGFSVITASDGAQAIEIFKERGAEIDAVLLDLTMPKMDGEETLKTLREMRQHITVVISSGYNEQDVSDRFKECPPDAFI